MSEILTTLFQPVETSDFYGLRDTISKFQDFVENKRKGEKTPNSILIIGDEGTGKSSLLNKLQASLTNRKDISYSFTLVPEEELLLSFFKEWENKIDELSPAWRSMLEKVGKKKLGDDLPKLKEKVKIPSNKTYMSYYTELFFNNLDKVNQKLVETHTFLYFFIDNFQMFKLLDIPEFYPIFASIINGFAKKNYNIIVAIAFNEKFLFDFDYEKFLTEHSLVLRVEHLTVSDTEIYLRRKAPQLLNKGVLDLVNTSQRSFFDLNLGVAFIEKNLGIQSFVERDIKSLFNLSDEEEEVLLELATYNDNIFPIEQLLAYVSEQALKKLEEKGILWLGTSYARFPQDSLLSTLKFRTRLFGPLTMLINQLDNILNDLESNIAPTSKVIEKVSLLVAKIRERLSYFTVASKIQQISNLCIAKRMFQPAYDLSLINAQQFEQIQEFEQAAAYCEKNAREFEEKNFYFAARLYVKSASYYSTVNEDLKAKRSYTRAADQFFKLALSLPLEKSEYAIRGYLKWSLDCYKNIGDAENFNKVKKKAQELFEEGSIHYIYFNRIKFEQKEQILVPEIEKSSIKEDELTLDNLEKELDF
ncbi:MAG: AAA family ATPase [Candidatus Heimdallarchaeaceae archaeon]